MTADRLVVVSLQAENVKRLKAVRITPDPDGSLVIVSGANGQGKTSVLDAVWLALGGPRAAKGTPVPVRNGEESARVVVDLGRYVVTRTWRADGTSTLKVTSSDGARFSSPQAMLDELVGRLSFDPLAFTQQAPKDQRATLLQLVELPFDLDVERERRAQWYAERTELGRTERRLGAQLLAMPTPPPGLPDEEVSLADLLREQRDRTNARHAAQAEQQEADLLDDRALLAERKLAELRELVVLAERHADDARAELDRYRQDHALTLPEDLPDPADLDRQLDELEQTNRAVRDAATRKAAVEAHRAAELAVAVRTEWIAALDETVGAALADAPLPLDGLAVVDDGVTYRGVPLQQASSAEQLRVSVAVAMALNPTVRVLRVSDGSLLDRASMAVLEETARDRGFQVWVERVDETGTVGVVIDDGEVVSGG